MSSIIGMICIGLGLAFDLFGCLGLVRLPDVYNRLQAATKCVTLGTCSILFGVLLLSGPQDLGLKALLCAVFILVTAPVAAHAISRGSYRSGLKLASGSVTDTYADRVDSEASARERSEEPVRHAEEAKVNR